MLRIINKLCHIKSAIRSIVKNTSNMAKNDDNRLITFRKVCDEIAEERSYNNKAKLLQNFLQKGTNKQKFQGDTLLWIQMLIPGASQRVYNLQNKQMLKLFSKILACDQQDMQQHLEQDGDVSATLCKYFENSTKLRPQTESTLYLQNVEEFLCDLEQRTKEDDQSELLISLCKQATALDLKTVIRLIKQDLRINAGARHILDALGPDAYPAYQATRDLAAVVKQFSTNSVNQLFAKDKKPTKKANDKVGQVHVMTPISPMLANACKSVEEAFKKSPAGLYSEIKYDGERVQIHKKDNEFKFFSRNLKPVMDHKVKRLQEYIPKAFPGVGEMILDSEIILVDTITGELLPFGSLGAHKKKEYANAEVCLFVFDCLLYNGDDLTNLTFRERRKILEDNIRPVQSYVQLSESHFLKNKNELSLMTAKVLKANLEGVVLKVPTGTYQPGKRGWLKVKKDYLFGGKMADTADLVVLGGWFGSGKKGGILSIFLMGCYDKRDGLWKTVTKVHSGLDDATNDEIHTELMQLMERADTNRTPNWLLCKKALVPDYIAKQPQKMPVWEITGAEFTKSDAHTAAGISIRFPRITKMRNDKSAMEANNLEYLQKLFDASKQDVNVDLLMANCNEKNVDVVEIDSKLNLMLTPQKNKTNANKELKSTSSKKRKHNLSKTDDEEEIPAKNSTEKKKPKLEKMIKSETKTQSTLDYFKTETRAQSTLDYFKTETKTKTSDEKMKINAKVEPQSKSNIFANLVAYFEDTVSDVRKYKSEFVANGGSVTENSKVANIAFYSDVTAHINMHYCRNNFKRTCRHLSITWLNKSIETQKCIDYPLHAVVLN